jgi:hypothetical protein
MKPLSGFHAGARVAFLVKTFLSTCIAFCMQPKGESEGEIEPRIESKAAYSYMDMRGILRLIFGSRL